MKGDQENEGIPVTVVTERKNGESVRSVILEKDLFDPQRSVGRSDDEIFFPVMIPAGKDRDWLEEEIFDAAASFGIIDDSSMTPGRKPNISPLNRIRRSLTGRIGTDLTDSLPNSWEKLGDCLVLKLRGEHLRHAPDIARAYMKILGCRYVLRNLGVYGELREPRTETLVPPADGIREVDHRENGILFSFDPERIMYSPGNIGERTEALRYMDKWPVGKMLGDGAAGKEIVVDMFAGIGYFSLPVASNGRCGRMLACEKNPVSHRFLAINATRNGLDPKFVTILGDSRASIPDGIADRILMGYVGGTIEYLSDALGILKERGGIIHLQDTVPVERGADWLNSKAVDISARNGRRCTLLDSRRVKSYAPRIVHIALDLLIEPAR